MTKTATLKGRVWLLFRWTVTIGALAWVLFEIEWNDRLIVDGEVLSGQVQTRMDRKVFVTDGGEVFELGDEARFYPGFWTLLRRLNLAIFALVTVAYPVSIVLQSVRWQWLLRTHDLDPGFLESLRLTWIGLLANNVLPGSTGGDLVKGWCIFRRTPGKRVAAVMTVVMDRVLGLVSLMFVGAVALFSQPAPPALEGSSRFVWWCLLVVLVGGMVFFSGRIRRLLRVSEIVSRLPFNRQIRAVDQSVFHYRSHVEVMLRCIGISLIVHVWLIGSVFFLGRSLDIQASLVHYYMLLPIIFTGSAFVPSIAGLGVMEGLFQFLFTAVDEHASSSAVALCILYRVITLVGSLPGVVPAYSEFSVHGLPTPLASEDEPNAAPADAS